MNNLRTSPLIFFMVYLLHRLYGVDAPGRAHTRLPRLESVVCCVNARLVNLGL